MGWRDMNAVNAQSMVQMTGWQKLIRGPSRTNWKLIFVDEKENVSGKDCLLKKLYHNVLKTKTKLDLEPNYGGDLHKLNVTKSSTDALTSTSKLVEANGSMWYGFWTCNFRFQRSADSIQVGFSPKNSLDKCFDSDGGVPLKICN